mmetsp:Transcript_10887/g.20260  ORF Transcript_10887/g.20260 Transcript_10887/m.20260 type:complete len:209 (-) Transcript_10887:134-760(-)
MEHRAANFRPASFHPRSRGCNRRRAPRELRIARAFAFEFARSEFRPTDPPRRRPGPTPSDSRGERRARPISAMATRFGSRANFEGSAAFESPTRSSAGASSSMRATKGRRGGRVAPSSSAAKNFRGSPGGRVGREEAERAGGRRASSAPPGRTSMSPVRRRTTRRRDRGRRGLLACGNYLDRPIAHFSPNALFDGTSVILSWRMCVSR